MENTGTTCKVKSCIFHHHDNLCAAGEIQVENNSDVAICDTFYPRNVNRQSISGRGVQAGTDLRDPVIYESSDSNFTPYVVCNVNDCIYWEDDVCTAEEITIDGPQASISDDTRCGTYEPL